jgi:hypothetical protein
MPDSPETNDSETRRLWRVILDGNRKLDRVLLHIEGGLAPDGVTHVPGLIPEGKKLRQDVDALQAQRTSDLQQLKDQQAKTIDRKWTLGLAVASAFVGSLIGKIIDIGTAFGQEVLKAFASKGHH